MEHGVVIAASFSREYYEYEYEYEYLLRMLKEEKTNVTQKCCFDCLSTLRTKTIGLD